MSYKESTYRKGVDKKKYDDNFDAIFRNKKKPMKTTHVEIEKNAKDELYGRVTRYHYQKRDKTKKGEAPAISFKKTAVECSLDNL